MYTFTYSVSYKPSDELGSLKAVDIIMQIYMNVVIIQFFVLIVYGQGEVPGVQSIKKCNEYLNNSLSTDLKPLSDTDLEYFRNMESGYVPPPGGGGFAGGHDARSERLSFIAALGYGKNTEKQYLCGGSLISPEFVVTAAHCLFASSSRPVTYVRLGDLNLTSAEDDQWVQELEVKEYFAHPKYEYPKKYHDIALLKLNKPAVINKHVYTICLEPQRRLIKFNTLYGAGWGALGHGEEPSSHLQVGELFHYTLKDCHVVYNSSFEIPEAIVDDLQICAGGGLHKVADTCAGDSGGPLFYIDRNLVSKLLGITSFGKPCGMLKIPGVYTRVSHYIDWIEKIVWPNNN